MLAFLVLNPPVEMAEKAWFTASNQSIPAMRSITVAMAVMPT